MRALSFIVPGPIDQLTGGYIFDKRLVTCLRADGWPVEVIELAGRFPFADEVARAAAAQAFERMVDGALVVIDGLALPAFEDALPRHTKRLQVTGFVHHPLSLETGLDEDSRHRIAVIESNLWRMLRGIVCPSEDSARAVVSAGVPREQVAVTPPGTDPVVNLAPTVDRRHRAGPVRLLAVGTVTARKGHRLLIDALSDLPSGLDWKLDCVGSLTRDQAEVDQLRTAIERSGLQSRVELRGELAQDMLEAAYAQADLFVLPSWHEGYGMVFAEAMARGLPIVSTTGGAIPELVPESAGVLVPPGDRHALTSALHRMIGDPALRAQRSAGAREAALNLPDWPAASARWIQAVTRWAA